MRSSFASPYGGNAPVEFRASQKLSLMRPIRGPARGVLATVRPTADRGSVRLPACSPDQDACVSLHEWVAGIPITALWLEPAPLAQKGRLASRVGPAVVRPTQPLDVQAIGICFGSPLQSEIFRYTPRATPETPTPHPQHDIREALLSWMWVLGQYAKRASTDP